MRSRPPGTPGQQERIQVEKEATPYGARINIRLETYDRVLGWYTCGSLSVPLQQLPVLEQALARLRAQPLLEPLNGRIIPFPGGSKGAF